MLHDGIGRDHDCVIKRRRRRRGGRGRQAGEEAEEEALRNKNEKAITRGGLIHIRAQKYASHHVDADFRELHISAGITHHPNLNPEGDAGFCWSLPETSKLNENSRTPLFSARTAAILMRH